MGEELEAGLLVVVSRGLGGARRILLGSVSEGIVHHARRPVLVTRGGEDAWPPARIVVADDSSEDARKTGELAAGIGKLVGARVVLVRVHPRGLEFSPEGKDALREGERDLEDRVGELEGLLGRRPEIEIRTGAGDPADAILGAAEEGESPTFVALGSRGLGAIQRVRLGSVSTKLIRAAPGPALVRPRP